MKDNTSSHGTNWNQESPERAWWWQRGSSTGLGSDTGPRWLEPVPRNLTWSHVRWSDLPVVGYWTRNPVAAGGVGRIHLGLRPRYPAMSASALATLWCLRCHSERIQTLLKLKLDNRLFSEGKKVIGAQSLLWCLKYNNHHRVNGLPLFYIPTMMCCLITYLRASGTTDYVLKPIKLPGTINPSSKK